MPLWHEALASSVKQRSQLQAWLGLFACSITDSTLVAKKFGSGSDFGSEAVAVNVVVLTSVPPDRIKRL